jgi:hypothetical protein
MSINIECYWWNNKGTNYIVLQIFTFIHMQPFLPFSWKRAKKFILVTATVFNHTKLDTTYKNMLWTHNQSTGVVDSVIMFSLLL